MKNNLILVGILVSLLAVTYVFQEKAAQKSYEEAKVEGKLLFKPPTSLRLPALDAQKVGESWWSQNTLLSHNIFKQIEKKLMEVKKVKALTGAKETFFKNPVSFDVNGVTWQVGDMSLDKEGFYLSVGDEIMLAIVEGESHQLTEEGSEIPKIKRDELLGLVTKPMKELIETQLFRFYSDLPMEKILIEADGRPSFELDLTTNETLPPPIPGISVHDDLRAKVTSLITQMTVKEKIPFDEKLKVTKLGQMKFIGKETVTWELWLKDKKTADSYIIDSENRWAFSMVGGTLRSFFIQVQDYWDKKIIPTSAFKEFQTVNVVFTQGSRSQTVIVENKEPLSFQGEKLEIEKLRSFFQLIFNLGPYDQADRVSLLSKTDRQLYLSGDHLKLTLFEQELLVIKKPEEIIVANLTQGFKCHFLMTADLVSIRFQDMIK